MGGGQDLQQRLAFPPTQVSLNTDDLNVPAMSVVLATPDCHETIRPHATLVNGNVVGCTPQ